MGLMRWLKLYPLVYLIKGLMRLLLATCKIKVEGIENLKKIAIHHSAILMLWHNKLVILSEILQRTASEFSYRAVISKSRDGEILALFVKSYAAGDVLRVPHNARREALAQMIKCLKTQREVIIITPDGPRGPPYQLKPGVAIAAREAQVEIIPFTWKANRYWELKTWDKMRIPKPFATIEARFGEPINLGDRQLGDLESDLKFLQEILLVMEKAPSLENL